MDDEFRAALVAYIQYQKETNKERFSEPGAFEWFEEYMLSGESERLGGIGKGIRVFYEMFGRYPTPQEMERPNGLKAIL